MYNKGGTGYIVYSMYNKGGTGYIVGMYVQQRGGEQDIL